MNARCKSLEVDKRQGKGPVVLIVASPEKTKLSQIALTGGNWLLEGAQKTKKKREKKKSMKSHLRAAKGGPRTESTLTEINLGVTLKVSSRK